MTDTAWLIVGIVCGLVSIGMAVWLYLWVHRQDPGTPQARKVAAWIREGAISYLKKLYRALLMLAAIIALLLFIVFGLGNKDPGYGLKMSLAFLMGALLSSVAGYMGMSIAVEANVRSAQGHLALAQARLNAGLGLPADVVRAQTAVSEAVFNLTAARNTASVARVRLAELMGIDPRTPIEIADTDEPVLAADDPNALTAQALKRRPEIAQANLNVAAARYAVGAARTVNSPAITANAGLLQRGRELALDSNTVFYGVAIEWTPFDAGFTAGRVEEARGNLMAAQARLDSTKLTVTSEVAQAYLNLKTAEQRAVTAEAEVANAAEAVRLTEGRYQSGLGTFIDVLDAQTALVTADTNRVNARSAVNQARAALAHAIGEPCVREAKASVSARG